jgi:hypothetical protein
MIDIWYGREQCFGQIGRPQRWANILGSVSPSDSVVRLSYALNHGPWQLLTLGPDGGRLLGEGDFNAEVPLDHLRPGENLVEIEAWYAGGDREVQPVALQYEADRVWPLPYHANWRSGGTLAAVQVVEGRWAPTAEGIRPVLPGYDRLLTVGDMSWKDYVVAVSASYNDLSHFAGFGILLRWTGHYPDGKQPSGEWRPSGAIGWYRARWEDDPARHRCLNISDGVVADRLVVESPPLDLQESRPYVHEFGVRSRVDGPSLYRYRVWPEGRNEEPLCDLSMHGKQGESSYGSALIIALHADVTIHWLHCEPYPAVA